MKLSAAPLLAASVAGFAFASEPPPDYGLDWVTIGAPGNRPTNEDEVPFMGFPRGAVGYEYRMTRTELTVSQWLEFVEAYAPHSEAGPNDVLLMGAFIHYVPNQGYRIQPGAENYPASPTWRFAARYANWLHNDKALTREAFEGGAYDTSTFGQAPGGGFTDNLVHEPDARFWIPSLDEWTKAVYFDPDRYGPGQEGYWLYPYGSNEVPVPGLPGEPGAQTNAGLEFPFPLSAISVGVLPGRDDAMGIARRFRRRARVRHPAIAIRSFASPQGVDVRVLVSGWS